jgi:hypothetical protein
LLYLNAIDLWLRSINMRIRQFFSVFTAALLFTIAPQTFAQDYTPSADVTAAIVNAQADGVVTDAEAAQLAQAMAADGADAAGVATTLSTNVGASSVQVAAGLASVGQTQNQIANTLVTTGVTTQADAQTTAQAGQTAAIATGNVTVVTTAAQAATVADTLTVNGSGLITDSSGKAVVVENSGDQILLVQAVISAKVKAGETVSKETLSGLLGVVESSIQDSGSDQETVTAISKIFSETIENVNSIVGDNVDISQDTEDFLNDLLDAVVDAVEEETGTDLDNDGGIGGSPNTVT